MDAIIDAPLVTIPDSYLPYLVGRDVQAIRRRHNAEYRLFPSSGIVSWTVALFMIIVIVPIHRAGDLAHGDIFFLTSLIAVLIALPLFVMASRKRKFIYRTKAYNEGIIKTSDAYLLRLEKNSYSLIPYRAVKCIRLVDGCNKSDGEVAWLDLEIEYKNAGTTSTYTVRDFILSFPVVFYKDSKDKRRAAAFFEGHFFENEFSSFQIFAEKERNREAG